MSKRHDVNVEHTSYVMTSRSGSAKMITVKRYVVYYIHTYSSTGV
jgi:hypothetical protein